MRRAHAGALREALAVEGLGRLVEVRDVGVPEAKSAQELLLRERSGGARVETGEFGAMMDVELVNDGPVTLILER